MIRVRIRTGNADERCSPLRVGACGRVRPVAHDVRRYGTCVRVAGGHWPPLRVGACRRVRPVAHDVRRYRALRQRADVGIRPYGPWRTMCAATVPVPCSRFPELCIMHYAFCIPYPSATSRAIIRLKPRANRRTPTWECSPAAISGISSSTTTYSIAPAAKLSR